MPSAPPNGLQRFFLHPMTALLFAYAVRKFMLRFQLVDFSHSADLAFVFVLAGYLLLSIRYEILLSVIFFSISLVPAYKAYHLSEEAEKPTDSQAQFVAKLHVAVSQIHLAQTDVSTSPASQLRPAWPEGLDHADYCFKDSCQNTGKALPHDQAKFWFWAQLQLDDKSGRLWYIDDSYNVYTLNDDLKFFPFEPRGTHEIP